MKQYSVVLSIAGSDPVDGAGIQGDIKAISANGGYAMAVITALTAQNTQGVHAIFNVPVDFIDQQLATLSEDITIDAIKIGMLSNCETIELISHFLKNYSHIPIVIDPVMYAKNGCELLDDRTVKNYFKYLEDASLIRLLQSSSKKMVKLEKPEKIYLNNPNQIQAITSGDGNIGNIRETYFINMLSPFHQINLPDKGDFLVDDTMTFEVGGRKKNLEQVKDIKNAFLACDNIELGIKKRIPLWIFGFLY